MVRRRRRNLHKRAEALRINQGSRNSKKTTKNEEEEPRGEQGGEEAKEEIIIEPTQPSSPTGRDGLNDIMPISPQPLSPIAKMIDSIDIEEIGMTAPTTTTTRRNSRTSDHDEEVFFFEDDDDDDDDDEESQVDLLPPPLRLELGIFNQETSEEESSHIPVLRDGAPGYETTTSNNVGTKAPSPPSSFQKGNEERDVKVLPQDSRTPSEEPTQQHEENDEEEVHKCTSDDLPPKSSKPSSIVKDDDNHQQMPISTRNRAQILCVVGLLLVFLIAMLTVTIGLLTINNRQDDDEDDSDVTAPPRASFPPTATPTTDETLSSFAFRPIRNEPSAQLLANVSDYDEGQATYPAPIAIGLALGIPGDGSVQKIVERIEVFSNGFVHLECSSRAVLGGSVPYFCATVDVLAANLNPAAGGGIYWVVTNEDGSFQNETALSAPVAMTRQQSNTQFNWPSPKGLIISWENVPIFTPVARQVGTQDSSPLINAQVIFPGSSGEVVICFGEGNVQGSIFRVGLLDVLDQVYYPARQEGTFDEEGFSYVFPNNTCQTFLDGSSDNGIPTPVSVTPTLVPTARPTLVSVAPTLVPTARPTVVPASTTPSSFPVEQTPAPTFTVDSNATLEPSILDINATLEPSILDINATLEPSIFDTNATLEPSMWPTFSSTTPSSSSVPASSSQAPMTLSPSMIDTPIGVPTVSPTIRPTAVLADPSSGPTPSTEVPSPPPTIIPPFSSCKSPLNLCATQLTELLILNSVLRPGETLAICGMILMQGAPLIITTPNVTICCVEESSCSFQQNGGTSGSTAQNLIVRTANVTLRGLSFEGGTSLNGGNGGNVFVDAQGEEGAMVVISDCVFTDGRAKNGGNLHVQGAASVLISNSRFDFGTAENGGGVSIRNTRHVTIQASSFDSNQCDNQGGGLRVYYSVPTTTSTTTTTDTTIVSISLSRFSSNRASRGAGFYFQNLQDAGVLQELDIVNSSFEGNEADIEGGVGFISLVVEEPLQQEQDDDDDLNRKNLVLEATLLGNTGANNAAMICSDLIFFANERTTTTSISSYFCRSILDDVTIVFPDDGSDSNSLATTSTTSSNGDDIIMSEPP